jgi:hypothetical protein
MHDTIRYTIRSFSFGLAVFIAHDIKLVRSLRWGQASTRHQAGSLRWGQYDPSFPERRLKTLLCTLLLVVPAHHSWNNIIEFAGTVLVKQIPAPCRTYQSC